MAVRNAVTLVDFVPVLDNIQEYSNTQMQDITDTYALYVYSQYSPTTLSVVGSGGNLSGLPMADTRYQAGTSTTRVDRFATEAETPDISIVTVNYSRISQTIYSGGIPVDTDNLRYPLYLYDDSGTIQLRAMSNTDFYDTFVVPALAAITASSYDYIISTATSVSGATRVSATPVFIDTRANTGAYTAGGIPETQDQPTTINNYYLHKYSEVAPSGEDIIPLPLYLDANNDQIRQYSLAQWAATLGPWLQYYMTQPGSTPSYSINGTGTTMGSAMLNTRLSPTGTGYTTLFVNSNDYRTQEFPNGTVITANTYELKKTTV